MKLKVTIDHDADALYMRIDDAHIIESEEVSPGVVVDYDAENRVVGVEMLYLSQRAGASSADSMTFESVGGVEPK